jgi:hypothetical protein
MLVATMGIDRCTYTIVHESTYCRSCLGLFDDGQLMISPPTEVSCHPLIASIAWRRYHDVRSHEFDSAPRILLPLRQEYCRFGQSFYFCGIQKNRNLAYSGFLLVKSRFSRHFCTSDSTSASLFYSIDDMCMQLLLL